MTTETEDRPPQNPWTRWTFVLSATFLGFIALIALPVLGLMWWDTRSMERDTSVAACERPATDDTRLAGAIPVQDWKSIGVSSLPVTDFGPSREEGGAPVCYEQSPQGAAMAAVHVATLASNGNTTMVLEHMAVDSPATDAALATTDVETVPENPTRALAVRLEDYTKDRATVAVALDTPAGPHSMSFTMVWENGDWMWSTPTESMPAFPLTSLSGYNSLGGSDG